MENYNKVHPILEELERIVVELEIWELTKKDETTEIDKKLQDDIIRTVKMLSDIVGNRTN